MGGSGLVGEESENGDGKEENWKVELIDQLPVQLEAHISSVLL